MNADLGSGTPEQIQAIVKDFWSAQEPILTSMQPAPDPIKADVETLLALAHHGASTGDSATFTSQDLQTADRNIDQYMLRECGYGQISITATDNAYHGIPATIGTGAVALTLDNQGRDAHQVLIVRINDGVTEPFSTLLDLPPDQRMQAATALGSVEVAPARSAPCSSDSPRDATASATSSAGHAQPGRTRQRRPELPARPTRRVHRRPQSHHAVVRRGRPADLERSGAMAVCGWASRSARARSQRSAGTTAARPSRHAPSDRPGPLGARPSRTSNRSGAGRRSGRR